MMKESIKKLQEKCVTATGLEVSTIKGAYERELKAGVNIEYITFLDMIVSGDITIEKGSAVYSIY